MATKGISGVGLAMATGGALIAYAGFRGVNPLQALKDVASGNPPAVESKSAGLKLGDSLYNTVTTVGQQALGISQSALAQAAYSFSGDKA